MAKKTLKQQASEHHKGDAAPTVIDDPSCVVYLG